MVGLTPEALGARDKEPRTQQRSQGGLWIADGLQRLLCSELSPELCRVDCQQLHSPVNTPFIITGRELC